MEIKEDFTAMFLDGLKKLRPKIYDEMEERPFRHDFANIIISGVLGWTRERRQGHYEVSEIRDITCFDVKGFPVIIVETKRPAESLEPKYVKRLGERLRDSGAEYGILTNGHNLDLYKLDPIKEMTKIALINIDALAQKEVLTLTQDERQQIAELKNIQKIRFIRLDEQYLIERHHKVKVSTDEGFHYLIQNLRFSLEELTDVLIKFFDLYIKSKSAHAEFLRDSFRDWCYISSREETEEARNMFSKETAYVLLNRILFTRVCEDKDILSQRLSGHGLATGYREREKRLPWLRILKDACEDAQDWYEHFYMLSMFDWWEIPEHLRGVLKSEEKTKVEECDKDLNNAIGESLKRFNPFDFSDVNRDILGHVYQEYLPPKERKKLGEFYTPIEVVRYILDAVGYTIDEKIEEKYLLDPACGSGTFLVETVTRLIEKYRKKIDLDDPKYAKLALEGIIEHIYGLDINPFACHIAEMNLLFHVIELYDKVRETDRRYKLPRFNIYRTDSLMPPEVGIKQLTLEKLEALNSRAKTFVDEENEAKKVKMMNFDFVVGNPPYVRKEKIPPSYKKDVLEPYHSEVYHGDNDICVYFISKGIDWLNTGGKFGYIVSGKFTKTRFGKYIRAYIPRKTKILQLLDLRGSKVFKEATNDPVILVLEKIKLLYKGDFKTVRVLQDVKEKPEDRLKWMIQHIRNHFDKEYIDDYIWSYPSSQDLLLGSISEERLGHVKKYWSGEWALASASAQKIQEKIEASSNYKLVELCEVSRGIETGVINAFVFSNEKTIHEHHLEKDLLKPLLRGEDVERWSAKLKEGYILYTHGISNEKELQHYPNIEEYLNQYKKKLESRGGALFKNKKWYELAKPRSPDFWAREKIITPDISERNTFAYEGNGSYCLETIFILTPRKEFERLLKYLLGLLNSKVLEFYFKQKGGYIGKKAYRYKKQYLEPLPIKLPQTSEERETTDSITQKVDQILQLNKQLYELEDKLDTFPEKHLVNVKKLAKVAWIMDSQELNKDSYKVSRLEVESFKDLTGRTKYKLILAKGNHIIFSTKEQVEYVLNWLRGKDSVTKNEILELGIPSEDNLHKIMEEYEEDKRKIDEIQQKVKGSDKEIGLEGLWDKTHPGFILTVNKL
jgi:type I restriction-modification system DNA methylase subunit